MATSGIVNGTLIVLKIGGSTVANLISNDENLKRDLIETTNKDTSGNATFIPGKFSATYSAELLHAEGATNGYSTLFGALTGKTTLSLDITSGVTGDKHYTCSALVADLKRTAPTEDRTGVSVTLQVTGAITEATI